MQDDTVTPATCANPPGTYFRVLRGKIYRWTRAVSLLAGAVVLLLVPSAHALTSTITTGSIAITLLPFFTVPSGAGAPLDLVSAGDGSGRLFVATRGGQILISDAAGHLSGTPFLDMASAGISIYTGGEGGLLGLAFSPFYSAPAGTPGSGKFYTFTTEPFNAADRADFSHPEIFPTTSVAPNNEIVIREWSVSATDPNLASTTSRVLMRIEHPQPNHQGGGLKFGPDNNLYLSLGDGGGANDSNPPTSSDGHTDGIGNAQDTAVVFGKILRINPTGNNSANGQYGIPADNPFAASSTKVRELFAYGLRNPFRLSFDRSTGALLAADAGQAQREEVDLITNGGNYGWVFREGTRDNTADSGRTLPSGFTSIAPIGEYTHADGDAVIGGFAYRGLLIPGLRGKYVFGDFQGTTGTGRLFYMDAAGGPISEFQYDTTGGGIKPPSALYSFGEDADGELYALFDNGQVLKLARSLQSPVNAACKDFNHDGYADLVWENTSGGQRGIWLLNNGVPFSVINLPTVAVEWRIAGVGDFNGDGYADLVWEDTITGQHALWLLNNGVLSSIINLPTVDVQWRIAGVGDFDGDGYADLVWENAATGQHALWLLKNGVVSSTSSLPTIAAPWRIAGAGDFDGDGYADLVWENTTTGQRALWFLKNGVLTDSRYLPTIDVQWRIAGAGDFDGDGYADLVWENTVSGQRALWFLKKGVLSSSSYLPTVPVVWEIADH